MVVMFRKLRGLLGRRSPSESERWAAAGAAMIEGMKRGFDQGDARRAELLASGMTQEQVQAVLLQEVVLNTDPAFLAYCEGVTRRSFWPLYEDDKENVA